MLPLTCLSLALPVGRALDVLSNVWLPAPPTAGISGDIKDTVAAQLVPQLKRVLVGGGGCLRKGGCMQQTVLAGICHMAATSLWEKQLPCVAGCTLGAMPQICLHIQSVCVCMQGNSIPADAEPTWATLEPWLRALRGGKDALLLLLDNAEELAASYGNEAQVCANPTFR